MWYKKALNVFFMSSLYLKQREPPLVLEAFSDSLEKALRLTNVGTFDCREYMYFLPKEY